MGFSFSFDMAQPTRQTRWADFPSVSTGLEILYTTIRLLSHTSDLFSLQLKDMCKEILCSRLPIYPGAN